MTPSDKTNAGTVEDLLWVLPKFWDRTARQIELSRTLLSHVPCVGSALGSVLGSAPESAPRSRHDIDVLDVIADGAPEQSPVATAQPSRTSASINGTALNTPNSVQAPVSSSPAPAESELAVPQYDSLAASQVIPRLEMLSTSDLQLILRYEESHRNRQTIIHKVRQLLAATAD